MMNLLTLLPILVSTLVFSVVSSDDSCSINEEIIIGQGESVIISSPGFEKFHYPIDSLCSWIVNDVSGSKRRLLIEFLLISIWPSYNCLFDGIILFDGNSTADPILGKFCTGTPTFNLTTSGPQLHALFYSSDLAMYPFRGFQIRITDTDPEEKCADDEIVCHNKECVNKNLMCDRRDDCGDGTDEESCGFTVLHSVPCGLASIPPDIGNGDRIVGGRAAIPGSWPWQCSLRRKGYSLYGHLCGAALVNDQWALTAAHCFRDRNNASMWTVHLGKFLKEAAESTEQVRYIKEIIIHPKYTGLASNPLMLGNKENDIALIRLNAPVTMTSFVRPICLPPWQIKLSTGTVCHVTGWGETLGTGNADVLKQAAVPIVSREICQKSYSTINISRSMICAGYPEGGHDSCKGDSGGPLVLKKRNRWYLVGLVSSGGDCAFPMQPGIYTQVSSFKTWISRMIWTHK
ncbi:Enteropeptidase [Araneus ventricosus]|uniref:Enteropeptidase n=1 Tax=Araneus ventricosus TaxID=182803 RepID=A0A4Y2BZD9_ARAVE|nr:Enteropeptidase [Araneus ventricosus]